MNNNKIKNVPIGIIKAYSDKLMFHFFLVIEEHFIDFDNNVFYEPEMLYLPQDSLKRLHKPDYTRKDAFLIGTTLYIYGKPYVRTMYDDEFGSAEVYCYLY